MTPVAKLILMLILPWIGSFLLLRSRPRHMWLAFTGIMTIQLFAILPIGYIAVAATIEASKHPAAANVQMASLYNTQYRVSQAQLHGLPGWQGVDITSGCGSPIYAPFSGIVTYQGLDGYNHVDSRGVVWDQATMLTIQAENGLELTLLHGNYAVNRGDSITSSQKIGTEASNGWSTGCHSHVILKQNGQILNFLTWQNEQRQNIQFVTSSDLLSISTYDPREGGTNCDENCAVMASGDNTYSWIGGKNGIYAAACPRSNGWHRGKQFEFNGDIFECRDTGGWINCYNPGDLDLAIQNAHSKGYLLDKPAIAEQSYCWVDLMIDSNVPYSTLTNNWSFK